MLAQPTLMYTLTKSDQICQGAQRPVCSNPSNAMKNILILAHIMASISDLIFRWDKQVKRIIA